MLTLIYCYEGWKALSIFFKGGEKFSYSASQRKNTCKRHVKENWVNKLFKKSQGRGLNYKVEKLNQEALLRFWEIQINMKASSISVKWSCLTCYKNWSLNTLSDSSTLSNVPEILSFDKHCLKQNGAWAELI